MMSMSLQGARSGRAMPSIVQAPSSPRSIRRSRVVPPLSAPIRRLAAGPGWRVSDIGCTAGPRHRPFEERHEEVSIAAVVAGSFTYRSRHGAVTLVPGTLLLGNPGQCFECGHAHGVGD